MTFVKTTWNDDATPDLTAAQLNRIEQGIGDLHGARAILSASANQSIPSAVFTTITPWDVAVVDTDGIHTASDRLTCARAGVYRVWSALGFTANATGARYLRLMLNAATPLDYDIKPTFGAGDITILKAYTEVKLAVGDYVQVQVMQNSGAALLIFVQANWTPNFGMSWVGTP